MLKYIFLGLFAVALLFFLISAARLLGSGRRERMAEEAAERALRAAAEKQMKALEKQGFHGQKAVYLPEAVLLADTDAGLWCMIRQGRETVSGPYPNSELTQVSVRENSRVILQKTAKDPAAAFAIPVPEETKKARADGRQAYPEACQSLRIYAHLQDPKNPTLSTPLVSEPLETNSPAYRRRVVRVNEALSLLAGIIGAK